MTDNPNSISFSSTPFSKYRTTVVDLMEAGMKKHNIHGFGQFDITTVKKKFAAHEQRTQEKLSLTAYLLYVIGKCVGEHPYMHACRKGNELITFEEVDISTIVEKEVSTENGKVKNPTNYVLRSVNKKTFQDVNAEIRAAQKSSFREGKNKDNARTKQFFKLPKLLRKMVWRRMLNDPFLKKKIMGTVALSAVGMFAGNVAGWALPITPMTLTFVVGGIEEKPKLVQGQLENHQFLCGTITIDHDILDGGPVARFCSRLYDMIDKAEGLEGI